MRQEDGSPSIQGEYVGIQDAPALQQGSNRYIDCRYRIHKMDYSLIQKRFKWENVFPFVIFKKYSPSKTANVDRFQKRHVVVF